MQFHSVLIILVAEGFDEVDLKTTWINKYFADLPYFCSRCSFKRRSQRKPYKLLEKLKRL